MDKKKTKKKKKEESSESVASDLSEGFESNSEEDEYERDENARREGPDNLARRSEWFQKRTGRL
jgi:hypothetical protein